MTRKTKPVKITLTIADFFLDFLQQYRKDHHSSPKYFLLHPTVVSNLRAEREDLVQLDTFGVPYIARVPVSLDPGRKYPAAVNNLNQVVLL